MAVLDQNGVPILALGAQTLKALADAQDSGELLTGETVLLHNRLPIHATPSGGADVTVFHIGGETLSEAAKSVVGAFDSVYGHRPPTRLACTHEALGQVLCEHYGARLVPVERLAP